ncbi:MAG: MBOAT family protein [Lachnospiraceae bacterium]|nr:MBOAT family protein [Lachnospiraceae bacterium]
MLFNSTEFLFFFPIVLLAYLAMPKKARTPWLLLASYFFYGCWNYKYLALILFTTVVTYAVGILLEKSKSEKGKKWILGTGITLNLLVLVFFKYLDFLFANISRLLQLIHVNPVANPFDFLLPVGISFFTFQAIGYVIDVYRGDVPAEKNFLQYALFVSFFPQLVAGPIERSKNLLGQLRDLREKKLWNAQGLLSGLGMVLWGLFMKMVIADRIAIFVNEVYANTYAAGTTERLVAAMGFSLQIYADFAGYSAVAIGASRMLGIRLMENFNTPLFSMSIAEFWRRWHISLSSWFRDYVYIPLGGNRKGKLRKYFNLMITFVLSGFWHGSAWKYIVWGGLHGVYQIVGELTMPIRKRVNAFFEVNENTFGHRLAKIAGTNFLVAFALIFFRADSLRLGLDFIVGMFTKWNPWVLFDDSLYGWGLNHFEVSILALALLVLLGVSIARSKKGVDIGDYLLTQNVLFRFAVLLFLALMILVFGEYGVDFDSNKFIYFDF